MPLMLMISLLIKMIEGGPVIYSQTRIGERGRKFTLYKFRTMFVGTDKDKNLWVQKNDARVTKMGKILRIMRMDELPQFWNVLKGDMSFIGPRPEMLELNYKIEKHVPYYNLRYLLKPGITGWAQVLYPYAASIEDALEKLQYDLYYIKNYSLLLDISIFLKTIKVVLLGKGGR
ncbi:MAG: sugar transferase [Halobacteriovoraceae bacterium]|nr:sugar transferase [Halobacteriovoraceae bacterium]